jgi:hypothetical protein
MLEPETFRGVEQCPNQLRHGVPHSSMKENENATAAWTTISVAGFDAVTLQG